MYYMYIKHTIWKSPAIQRDVYSLKVLLFAMHYFILKKNVLEDCHFYDVL